MGPKKPKGNTTPAPVLPELRPEVQLQNMMEDITQFQAQQFDMTNAPIETDEPLCQIIDHPEKGRVLVATSSFMPGDLIFKERAFVSASWHEFHCIECFQAHKAGKCERVLGRYPRIIIKNLTMLEEALADIHVFGDLDRARCFIKCMLLLANSPDASPLQQLLALDTNFEAECLEGIAFAKRKQVVRVCNLFPDHIPDEIPARLLSVLKCNSHEIENVGGSGVFLYASMMEHACIPNCNFVTETDQISIIAIQPIKEGDCLAIDYSQAFYRPTAERRKTLLASHCFTCNCTGCTILPDRCRSFNCPAAVLNRINNIPEGPGVCLRGIVSPIGTGETLESWKCLDCQRQLTQEEVNICLDAEQRYPAPDDDDDEDDDDFDEEIDEEQPPRRSLDDIQAILSENVMTDAHYSIFWSLMKLGHYFAKQASKAPTLKSVAAKMNPSKNKKKGKSIPPPKPKNEMNKLAEQTWLRIIAAADIGIPGYHNDKCNYLDCLAQVLMVAKNMKGAVKAWQLAYEMSCVVCGKHTIPTLQLLRLVRRPPRTTEELMFHYQNVSRVLDQIKYEEDHESAALMISLAESHLDENNNDDDNHDDDDDELDEDKGFFYKSSNSLADVARDYAVSVQRKKEEEERIIREAAEKERLDKAKKQNSLFGQFTTSSSSTSFVPTSTNKPFGSM